MIRSIFGAGLLLAASAAAAAPADDAADVRCLIVAAELADNDDAELEEAGTIMTMYFLGRLHGRSPGANLDTILAREAATMSEDDKQRLLLSCSDELATRAKEMETLGSSLGG